VTFQTAKELSAFDIFSSSFRLSCVDAREPAIGEVK
jgi:hypothetical protein